MSRLFELSEYSDPLLGLWFELEDFSVRCPDEIRAHPFEAVTAAVFLLVLIWFPMAIIVGYLYRLAFKSGALF
jgi:hypothetical protein